jgi:hypothetical protein
MAQRTASTTLRNSMMEQVGAGREELEDFDEAADGEPVLMADAWALVESNSNAVAGDRHQFFLGWRTSGGPRPWPSRPIEVCGRRRALRLTTPRVVRPMSHRDRCGPRGFDEAMDRYPKLLELLAIGLPPPGAPF